LLLFFLLFNFELKLKIMKSEKIEDEDFDLIVENINNALKALINNNSDDTTKENSSKIYEELDKLLENINNEE